MKINFPKIVKTVGLGDYAEEMKGQIINVWVNPPASDLVTLGDNYKKWVGDDDKEAEKNYMEKMSELLSQGEKASHFSVDELKTVRDATAETDPAFWIWLQTRIIEEVNNHRLGLKKSFSAATTALASGGGTNDPYLVAVIQARHIYEATGQAIWPWEVDDMPPDWLEAIFAVQVEVEKKRRKINNIQAKGKHGKR